MLRRGAVLIAIVFSVWLQGSAAAQLRAGPQGTEEGPWRKQLWLIPARDGRLMHVNVLRPAGAGPFPLAVMNHGSPPKASVRPTMQVPVFPAVSEWLVARGYLVALPLRRGYGATGGDWREAIGPCQSPDFVRAGHETAADIEAVVAYLTQQPGVKKDSVVVLGQSAGGWGTLALASKNLPSISAYVNFAGGRGGHRGGKPNSNCAPDALVSAAGTYGHRARKPTLWIYTANDSFFAPELARRMHTAFTARGGIAKIVELPEFGDDGHRLTSRRDGVSLWAPHVERFLAAAK